MNLLTETQVLALLPIQSRDELPGQFLRNVTDLEARKFLLLFGTLQKSSLSSAEKFHNSYYWFAKYVQRMRDLNGFDAGLEQQAFQLLEHYDGEKEPDWNLLEQIDRETGLR